MSKPNVYDLSCDMQRAVNACEFVGIQIEKFRSQEIDEQRLYENIVNHFVKNRQLNLMQRLFPSLCE